MSTSADISKASVRASIDNFLRHSFDNSSARKTRVGNAPPALVYISTQWPFGDLARLIDLDHLNHGAVF